MLSLTLQRSDLVLDDAFDVAVSLTGAAAGGGFAVALLLRPDGKEERDVVIATDSFPGSSNMASVEALAVDKSMVAEALELDGDDSVSHEILAAHRFSLVVQGGGFQEGVLCITLSLLGESNGEIPIQGTPTSLQLLALPAPGHRVKLLTVLRSCRGALWNAGSTTTEVVTESILCLVKLLESNANDTDVVLDVITLLQEFLTNPEATEPTVCSACRALILIPSDGLVVQMPVGGAVGDLRAAETLAFHNSCVACGGCRGPFQSLPGGAAALLSDDEDRLLFHAECIGEGRGKMRTAAVTLPAAGRCDVNMTAVLSGRVAAALCRAVLRLQGSADEAVRDRTARLRKRVEDAWQRHEELPAYTLLVREVFGEREESRVG
jgi:hypothetical protein